MVIRKQPPLNSGQVEWLPRKKLTVDARLQRPLRPGWVAKRKSTFNAEWFRTIEISARRTGQCVILDGMHRVALLDAIGYADQLVPCVVHHGLTFEQEAEIFIGCNDFVRPQFIDFWRQRLNANEEVAVAVAGIIGEHGLTIARGPGDKCLHAVQSVERVYLGDRGLGSGRNPKALRDTLWTVIAAWGTDSPVFAGVVVEGIGKMFLRDASTIDRKDLAERLAKQGSVARLIGRARGARETHSVQMPRAIAGVATDLYNKGRRVNKLASWWAS